MRDYKGWTAEERRASLKKTKAAIAAGQIPQPTKCNRCGKTTGRIDYHNHPLSGYWDLDEETMASQRQSDGRQ